jgi:hypothetical protein
MTSVITAILFVSALASTALAATKVSFPFADQRRQPAVVDR